MEVTVKGAFDTSLNVCVSLRKSTANAGEAAVLTASLEKYILPALEALNALLYRAT